MGWPVVHANKKLLEKGREKGFPIFFTRGQHGKTISERSRWKHETYFDKKEFNPKIRLIISGCLTTSAKNFERSSPCPRQKRN